jgi:CRP/FNR family transcriptional regulator, cyclic AMP receptor protein
VTPQQFLVTNPLLRGLTPEEIRDFLRHTVVKRFPTRTTVFLRDDNGDGVYGVLEGSVSVTVESADGAGLILRLLEPGQLFGELAVLDGRGRTASVVARAPCTLLFMPRAAFLHLLATHSEVAARLVPLLAAYLRQNTCLVSDALFLDVRRRLARQLIELSATQQAGGKVRPAIRVSQYELACMLGVSREIVNRHLTTWRRRGLVEMSRGRIRLVDGQGMLALAQETD